MSDKKTLLRGGCVLSMDDEIGDLPRGDVLIEGTRIAAVAPRLDDVTADEEVDASGTIVLPGLIDAHIHLWQSLVRGLAAEAWSDGYLKTIHPMSGRYTADDMRTATYAGALELLRNGVTTAFDFCHSVNSPEFGDGSVDALEHAGIRAIFGYGFHDRPEAERRAFAGLDERLADAHRLRSERLSSDDGLVQMGVALSNWGHASTDAQAREVGCARELGVPATVHLVLDGHLAAFARRDLLGPDIVWVHATTVTDDELRQLAEHGGVIASTPEVEVALEGLYPIAGRALALGVPATLGADVFSVVSGDLIVQMRIALQVERLRNAQLARVHGRIPEGDDFEPGLTARQVLGLTTIDAARALGLDDRIGSLTPGKQADILMLSTEPFGLSSGDPAAHVVVQSNVGDVENVLVAGQFRKRAGELVDVDLRKLTDEIATARERLLSQPPPKLLSPDMDELRRLAAG